MGVIRMNVGTDLTIHQVSALAPALIDAARCRADAHLNLSDVQRCDTAGVQLLLLLQREARQSGTRLHLDEASPVLCELLQFYREEQLLEAGA